MQPSNTTIKEHSAGTCVFRVENGTLQWLIGLHSGYHKWVLPKGRLEEGETAREAALRETLEEAGVVAKILESDPIHTEKYQYQAVLKTTSKTSTSQPERRILHYQEDQPTSGVPMTVVDKTVDFFLAQYQSGSTSDHSWEMSEVVWLEFEVAYKKLAFEGERLALKKAALLVSKM